MLRLGVVSFLNARPLIAGLAQRTDLGLHENVPAALTDDLVAGAVDAALIPIVDVLRSQGRFHVLSDGCIASDGETMTVRVFSKIPPEQIESLWVDADSHTSVALARLIWRHRYGRKLELRRTSMSKTAPNQFESVLLIGDKVVTANMRDYPHQIDLGSAWKEQTGLPFVFAVWAYRNPTSGPDGGDAMSAKPAPRFDTRTAATILSAARDRGIKDAHKIATVEGPARGWPVAVANRYLTQCMKYKLDQRTIAGANLFGELSAEADVVPHDSRITWSPQWREELNA